MYNAQDINHWDVFESQISPLDKIAAILADDNFKCIFLNENDWIPIQISLKFVSQESDWQWAALVQVMA